MLGSKSHSNISGGLETLQFIYSSTSCISNYYSFSVFARVLKDIYLIFKIKIHTISILQHTNKQRIGFQVDLDLSDSIAFPWKVDILVLVQLPK